VVGKTDYDEVPNPSHDQARPDQEHRSHAAKFDSCRHASSNPKAVGFEGTLAG
jgi:hypothetical protein